MSFHTKYSGITYLPYPHYRFLGEGKKIKYLDNYQKIVHLLHMNRWIFMERNLTTIDNEKLGHELWNGKTCAVRVSYPYVSKTEYKWIKQLITQQKILG